MELTSIVERIFSTIFPMLLIVTIGYLYARKKPTSMAAVNSLNIDVFIPALIFSVLSAKSFELMAMQQIAMGATMIIIGSGLLLYPICKLLKIEVKTFIPPMMFSNSGNLGLPLLVLAFGDSALNAAVVLFIVEMFLHFTLGIYILDRNTSLLKVLRLPMIIATFAGLGASHFNIEINTNIQVPLEMMGMVCVPLMLFSLGVRMIDIDFSTWKIGLWGAFLAPASGIVIALLIHPMLNLSQQHFAYLIIFAALPPALLNYMLAEKYNQQPGQVASIVLIGNIGSILILPVTLYFVL
ncbi:MAG: AEC family transporter [Oceanospirillaceae bacterium]|nr:AEC family transporter [Oceanospirillaceae bacterium]